MSGFNMPPGVSPGDIPGNDDDKGWAEEGDMQAHAVMTLRDVFAAHAMNGLLASYAGDRDAVFNKSIVAALSYTVADEMLKARAR